jgi:Flp pilus assembly protein TadG
MTTLSRLRRAVTTDSGGALIELAVALPVLILILVAAIDFSRVFYTAMALTNAARAGAQFGSHSTANSGNFSAMQTTAVGSVNTTGVTAAASRTCQCATDTGVFSPTSPTVNDCISPESVSCNERHLVITVTVTASKTFNTIFGNVPGIPNTINLVRTATQRVVN